MESNDLEPLKDVSGADWLLGLTPPDMRTGSAGALLNLFETVRVVRLLNADPDDADQQWTLWNALIPRLISAHDQDRDSMTGDYFIGVWDGMGFLPENWSVEFPTYTGVAPCYLFQIDSHRLQSLFAARVGGSAINEPLRHPCYLWPADRSWLLCSEIRSSWLWAAGSTWMTRMLARDANLGLELPPR